MNRPRNALHFTGHRRCQSRSNFLTNDFELFQRRFDQECRLWTSGK